MKKWLVFTVACLFATILAAMPIKVVASSNVILEVAIGGEVDQNSMAAMKKLIDGFTAQTGIQVEIVSNGNDHEAVMKTRMASNNMPDLWTTHGWSVLRYGEYARDLSDQEWVARVDAAVKTVVTDNNGEVKGCPLTQWTYGIVFDEQVLENNGIDPYAIKTFDDFYAAAAKLSAAGVTPFSIGTKGGTSIAGQLEMMSSFFTIDGAPYPANDELKNGTFDFTKNTQLIEKLAEAYDNGWFNEDIFTADATTALQYLGTGNFAFRFWGGTTDITSLNRYFPDRTYGFLPVPAVLEGGNAAVTVGEGTCFAVSKDTDKVEESLALLNYLARSENIKDYAIVNGGLPGFQNIELGDSPSLVMYNKAVEAAGDSLKYTNFFDREYLPSGMWNAMQEAGATIYNGDVGTAKERIPEAAAHLQDAYNSLY